MADTFTPNLNLRKADLDSVADVNLHLNQNWDKLDANGISGIINPTNSFVLYSPSTPIRYSAVRVGSGVIAWQGVISGIVSPANATVANNLATNTTQQIARLPASLRATIPAYAMMQGSVDAIWHCSISGADGYVRGARYRGGTPSTTSWLNFTLPFMVLR